MAVDKKQLAERVGLIWTNFEEKDYLLSLIENDMVSKEPKTDGPNDGKGQE